MKKLFVCAIAALLMTGAAWAQAEAASDYHLVVIDRARCPGAAVQITQPLSVTSHGRTGYYIVFGRGAVTIPSGAKVLVNLASSRLSVITGYLQGD